MFLSIILLIIVTLMVYFGDFADRTVSLLILSSSSISVFASAFILARNILGGGLINGLVLGIMYCAVLIVLSVIINGAIAFDAGNITRLTVVPAAGMLGGVWGINTSNSN